MEWDSQVVGRLWAPSHGAATRGRGKSCGLRGCPSHGQHCLEGFLMEEVPMPTVRVGHGGSIGQVTQPCGHRTPAVRATQPGLRAPRDKAGKV